MKYSLILNKFEIDLNRLKKKLKSFEIDKLTGRINTDEKVELEEVDKILFLENENFFSLEDLRKDISKIKFNNFNLRVKSYVKIPSGTIKKKLYPVVNKKLNENSENNILIELFKEGKIKYRIFSYKEMKNENEFIKFVKEKKNLLFVFGNDTFGLSQKVRDDLDASFSLGKDKIKPMKGNQALAYVLGLLKE